MPPKTETSWYNEMPTYVKVVMQLGFAGLIGVLFLIDSRDRSNQLREMQTETRNQSREDRQMFREELKSQREELKSAVEQMKRAIDTISLHQLKMKSEIDDIKFPFPKPKEKQ